MSNPIGSIRTARPLQQAVRAARRRHVDGPRSQPAANKCCRLSGSRPTQTSSVSQPPLTTAPTRTSPGRRPCPARQPRPLPCGHPTRRIVRRRRPSSHLPASARSGRSLQSANRASLGASPRWPHPVVRRRLPVAPDPAVRRRDLQRPDSSTMSRQCQGAMPAGHSFAAESDRSRDPVQKSVPSSSR